MTEASRPKFEEIDVERINVVDPQGRPRFVLTNAERLPDPVVGGQTLQRGGRHPCMIFYNDEGDECGGLQFGGRTRDDGRYEAGALLAFDQCQQDQALFLTYEDDNGRRRYGLQVMDRPAASHVGPEGGGNERVGYHDPRVFAGRTDEGEATVSLCDQLGRPRLRVAVALDGTARIEFLDEAGKATFSLGPDGTHTGDA